MLRHEWLGFWFLRMPAFLVERKDQLSLANLDTLILLAQKIEV